MFLRDKISKWMLLAVFVLGGSFGPGASALSLSPESKQLSFEAGSLLKIKGQKGAAVYQIGSDNKKYVYPDQKTFETWYDDFEDVVEVELEDLDKIDDGGTVSIQPGTKLITHRDTAKVYAVGDNGNLSHIPDEATARKFYGDKWNTFVIDVDPGIFSISYKARGKKLSDDDLPDGSLIEEESSGKYYYMENGKKRPVLTRAFGSNGFYRKHALRIKKFHKRYSDDGDDIDTEEEDKKRFDPGADHEKVAICHKPSALGTRQGKNMKVSRRALKAHLGHGDYEGRCENNDDDDDDDDVDRPECTIGDATNTRKPLRTTYWNDLGLDTSANPEVIAYKIQWFAGHWSPWYTPGIDDVDWKVSTRRVWSYFQDHNHRVKICGGDEDEDEDDDDEDDDKRVDISVESISVTPEFPGVGEEVTVTVTGKNRGGQALTSGVGVLNFYRPFEDFTQTELIVPTVSSANPILPDEKFYFYFKGSWQSAGVKKLAFLIDNTNELAESDEINNSALTEVHVGLLNTVATEVFDISTSTATIWWKASAGSNGQYRYATSSDVLGLLDWSEEGVDNNPDTTGNLFASRVRLDNLLTDTQYFVDLRKYLMESGQPKYGQHKIIDFRTLNSNATTTTSTTSF